MAREKDVHKKHDSAALFIPAGVILGVGVGLLLNQVAAGAMIGLGLGFLSYAIISVMKRH